MPKDIKTNIVIGAQTKGFDEAQQKASKFNKEIAESTKAQAKGFADAQKQVKDFGDVTAKMHQSFGKSSGEFKKHIEAVTAKFANLNSMDFAKVQSSIGNLKDHLQDLGKEQLAVTSVMEDMADKASPAYKKLEDHLKSLNAQSRRAKREISGLTQAFSKQAAAAEKAARAAQQAKGAFVQGMAQGGLGIPAAFAQRGPGFGKQLAGMGVGRAVSGFGGAARGIAGAAFSGVGGLAQAISGIPIAGPAAAAQLQTAAAYSQQYLQFQKQRIGMIPYMTSPEKQRKLGKITSRGQRELDLLEGMQATQAGASQASQHTALGKKINIPELSPEQRANLPPGAAAFMEGAIDTGDLRLQGRIAQQKHKVARLMKMRKGTAAPGLAGLGDLGMNLLGVNKVESERAATSIVQAGGGQLGEARRHGIVGAGFAAQTMFGVQSGVSGAFLQGARRGGLVGGGKKGGVRAGSELQAAIQDGFRMGLSGSEINTYLQSIAAGIQRFESTGIPVARESLADMGQEFQKSGITGTRAAKIAGGIQNYAQGMGQRGIRGGGDLLMLQMMGGYKGGGAEGLQQSFLNLEDMKSGGLGGMNMGGKTAGMLRKVMKLHGGGAGGEFGLMNFLTKQMGTPVSMRETMLLSKQLQDGKLTKDESAYVAREDRRRKQGSREAGAISGKGLTSSAASAINNWGSSVKKQAEIQNKQLSAGKDMIKSIQALDGASANISKTFTGLVDGPLTSFSKGLEALTGKLEAAVAAAGWLSGGS